MLAAIFFFLLLALTLLSMCMAITAWIQWVAFEPTDYPNEADRKPAREQCMFGLQFTSVILIVLSLLWALFYYFTKH